MTASAPTPGPMPAPINFDPAHPDFDAFAGMSTTASPTDAAGSSSEETKQSRLTKFATDNGLTYTPFSQLPYPGCIFTPMNTGAVSFVREHLSTTNGRYVDIGNFEPFAKLHVKPDGQLEPGTPQFMRGFVALQMDRQLPNMMLISKLQVAGETVLPFTPDPDRAPGLEGNFDDYFTLYCPKEFERAALYVFTPDLMALLIDEATPFDVEIVDKWMFLYASHPFDSLDPEVYRRIFRILDTVGTKVVGQTTFFSDPDLGSMPDETPATGWHFVPNPALFGEHSPTGTRLKPKSQLPGLYLALRLFVLFGASMFFLANLMAGGF